MKFAGGDNLPIFFFLSEFETVPFLSSVSRNLQNRKAVL